MKPPVILQNIRLHGLGGIIDTKWITVGRNITFFELPGGVGGDGIVHTLQSVNPPEGYRHNGIFQNYPKIIRQGKYQKRVRPEKRTVAFAIFIAQPEFVTELAEITPHLYETDRIEVGRRLDCSRWVNFVEIASSTRWSEIDKQLLDLAERYPSSLDSGLRKRLEALERTDRIEGSLLTDIDNWLAEIAPAGDGPVTAGIDELRFSVCRWQHFRRAKQLVRKRLPVFVDLGSSRSVQAGKAKPEKTEVEPDIALDRLVEQHRQGDDQYLVVVDEPSLPLDGGGRRRLRCHAAEAARHLQILYFTDTRDDLQLPGDGVLVRLEDEILD